MGRGPNRAGTSGSRFTEARKEVYFSELRRAGLKPVACLVTNVSRCTVWKHRRRYPEFAEAESDALVAFNMEIHMEIKRRGVEGVERTITVAGKKEAGLPGLRQDHPRRVRGIQRCDRRHDGQRSEVPEASSRDNRNHPHLGGRSPAPVRRLTQNHGFPPHARMGADDGTRP